MIKLLLVGLAALELLFLAYLTEEVIIPKIGGGPCLSSDDIGAAVCLWAIGGGLLAILVGLWCLFF